jgi:hypothetical protein
MVEIAGDVQFSVWGVFIANIKPAYLQRIKLLLIVNFAD